MNKPSWVLPVFGYPGFFLFCFLLSLYATFPMSVLKPRIMEELTKAVNSGQSPGAYGKPGRVTVDSIDLYRFSGLDFKNLTIYPVTTNPDPPLPIEVDRLKVRVLHSAGETFAA